MADADCEICFMLGYRTCDVCLDIVTNPVAGNGPYGRGADLCDHCRASMFGGQIVTRRAAGDE